jgi:hypothetical protein
VKGALSLTIHKTRLTLESNSEDFITYARGHLAMLLSPPVETPDVHVRLHWGQQLISARSPIDDYHRLSRRLLLGKDEIVQTEILLLPGLQLRTSLAGANVSVDAAFRPPSRRMRLLMRLGGKASQDRIYAALIYYLVYFPLLWHIERTRQWYPLHASAVAWPQGAVVLAGLGGVGKSTLTLAFLSDPHARLLSENVIIHDQERVYAFPEPIHLDERSRKMLSRLNGRLKPTDRAYSHNRQSYEVPISDRVQSAKPRLFCTLRQGKKLNLRSMSAEETLEFTLSSNVLARELDEYAQQAAVLNLLSPIACSFQRRIEALQQFLNQMPCYELVVRPGENLNQVVALVRGRLEW